MKASLGVVAILASLVGLDVVDSDRTVVVVAGWAWFLGLLAIGLAILASTFTERRQRRPGPQ